MEPESPMPKFEVRASHGVGRRARGAPTTHADRIDLLDEPDRASLLAGDLAQVLEERADPIRRHALPHRLERRSGDEQERDPRLLRHGLREVGLAGAGRAFEQDASARRAAQLVAEGGVAQEHVERTHDLVDLGVQPLDVGEAGFDLLGVDRDVWGPAVEQRHRHHQQDRDQDQEREEQDHPVGRQRAAGSADVRSSSGSRGRDRGGRPRSAHG